jgi:hypothetical protein
MSPYFPLSLTAIERSGRFSSVMMTIANCMFAIAAIGIVCAFFYLRGSILAYRLTVLLPVSLLLAQLLFSKWLRQKGIAIQMLLFNLYITAVIVAALERDIWRGSILGLVFAFMTIRYLVEILQKLRRPMAP